MADIKERIDKMLKKSEVILNAGKPKLLPCPFCKGEAKRLYTEYGNSTVSLMGYFVECQKCHVRTDEYDTEAEAIEAWNKRAYHECDESCDYFKGVHWDRERFITNE